MADPGSRPAAGGSTEHLCQLSLGKWISGLNAHLVSRYRFVIYVISGIFPPEGVVIAGLLARPPSFLGSHGRSKIVLVVLGGEAAGGMSRSDHDRSVRGGDLTKLR
jgi:hypothetical protein